MAAIDQQIQNALERAGFADLDVSVQDYGKRKKASVWLSEADDATGNGR